MTAPTNPVTSAINRALIGSLYAEALVLADEARAWFDRALQHRAAAGPTPVSDAAPAGASARDDAARDGDARGDNAQDDNAHGDALFQWAGRHDTSTRIALSCESLRLTTRLMHIIAWLLLQRAILAGELPAASARVPSNRLGDPIAGDTGVRAQLPHRAQQLIGASERLYERVAQLDAALDGTLAVADPVGAMMNRLHEAL